MHHYVWLWVEAFSPAQPSSKVTRLKRVDRQTENFIFRRQWARDPRHSSAGQVWCSSAWKISFHPRISSARETSSERRRKHSSTSSLGQYSHWQIEQWSQFVVFSFLRTVATNILRLSVMLYGGRKWLTCNSLPTAWTILFTGNIFSNVTNWVRRRYYIYYSLHTLVEI